ncbi:MAG TPA: cytochrome P450 [Streptosporangiaceae bacterium]|nr:cytochrome P450 [Streptosporangiaceae bacterium]
MDQLRSVPPHMRRTPFDPVDDLARCRAEAPVSRAAAPLGPLRVPAWLIARYQDVRAVLGDAAGFSNSSEAVRDYVAAVAGEETAERLPLSGPSLIGYDPPVHTRLRRMVAPRFTVKRMRSLQPRIEAIVAEHLDAMAEAGAPADLLEAFALPMSSLVICELLGVPYDDRAAFQRRGSAQLDLDLDLAGRQAAFDESHAYMADLVRGHRAGPGDNLLGALVREHGDELSDEELTELATLLLVAGHETTANMLALGTLLLLRHPDQLALLRDDPSIAEGAVEELMRYLSIVHTGVVRTALRDVTIAGTRIKAGDAVMCSLPSANRDESVIADPDVLDLTRKPTAHVAFGHGIHHCLGAPLARLELRIAFPALLRRFPGLRLAVPFEELRYRPLSVVYGVRSLPVTW